MWEKRERERKNTQHPLHLTSPLYLVMAWFAFAFFLSTGIFENWKASTKQWIQQSYTRKREEKFEVKNIRKKWRMWFEPWPSLYFANWIMKFACKVEIRHLSSCLFLLLFKVRINLNFFEIWMNLKMNT